MDNPEKQEIKTKIINKRISKQNVKKFYTASLFYPKLTAKIVWKK